MKMTSPSKLIPLFLFGLTAISSAITGTVTDTLGNPLPNISLTYLNSRGTFFTDARGEFSDRNGTPVTPSGDLERQLFSSSVENNAISFSLQKPEQVSFEVFAVNGRKLFSYQNRHSAGEYTVPVGDLAKGIYFLQSRVGSEVHSQKFLAGRFGESGAKGFSLRNSITSETGSETGEPKAVDTLIIYSRGYEEQRLPLYSLDDETGTVKMVPTEYNRVNFPDYWVLIDEVYGTFNRSTSYKATPDSALECIGIKDSVITHYGDEYSGGGYPFLINNRDNYCLAGNYLVFSHSNGTDYRISQYEQVDRYYGVRFWNRSFTVPQELLGTWYLTDSVSLRYDESDGDSISKVLQYPEFIEAEWAVKITADSIYHYDRDGWECDTAVSSIRYRAKFLRELSVVNGEMVAGYSNYVNSFPSYSSKKYRKFDGDISPWFDFTVPDETVALKNAVTQTQSVAVGDTLWFSFDGVKSQRYKYVILRNNVELWGNMVDCDTLPRSHMGNSRNGLFNTTKTGTYYIALVVKKVLDDSQPASVSIKVETSNW